MQSDYSPSNWRAQAQSSSDVAGDCNKHCPSRTHNGEKAVARGLSPAPLPGSQDHTPRQNSNRPTKVAALQQRRDRSIVGFEAICEMCQMTAFESPIYDRPSDAAWLSHRSAVGFWRDFGAANALKQRIPYPLAGSRLRVRVVLHQRAWFWQVTPGFDPADITLKFKSQWL